MHLLVTASFAKATKKLHARQKAELDAALKGIYNDPTIGEAKVGDLLGMYVCKFSLSEQQCLLAHRILNRDSIKLLIFGHHENFYRDLKR